MIKVELSCGLSKIYYLTIDIMELLKISDIIDIVEYLKELQKQDKNVIKNQLTFYWDETVDDLYYRIKMWYIPIEDLKPIDKKLIKIYESKINLY